MARLSSWAAGATGYRRWLDARSAADRGTRYRRSASGRRSKDNPRPRRLQQGSCERYRYKLWRKWDDFPPVNFLMLNPSTADELVNDPTIERCERRAKSMGFGGLIVTNLFAFRATDPADMKACVSPVGVVTEESADNDMAILTAAGESQMVICGWGSHGKHLQRSSTVIGMLLGSNAAKLHSLKVNADGSPMHPLYVSYSCQPVPYTLQ